MRLPRNREKQLFKGITAAISFRVSTSPLHYTAGKKKRNGGLRTIPTGLASA